jgi:hypothetical protein
VTVHGASFMAVTEFDGGGAHTYEDVRVAVRPAVQPGALCAGGRRSCEGVLTRARPLPESQ